MSNSIHQLLGLPTMGSNASHQFEVKDNVEQHPLPRRRAAIPAMNAAFIMRTGGTDMIQYGKLPRPVPAHGQVLIKVGAAAVNPLDLEVRSGNLSMPLRFPQVIGSDVAGTVVTCGIGIRQFSDGARVWGSNQGMFGRQGTFAEYVAVDERWLYPTPAQQSDAEAAAGAMTGITACLGLFNAARLQSSEIVFVHCGADGIGSSVIQQAKAAGARVITTAGGRANEAYCRELRADLVLDHQSPMLYDQIREFSDPIGGIDVWIETQPAPILRRTIELMALGGRIVAMAGHGGQAEVPLNELQSANISLLGVSMRTTLPDVQRKCATALNARFKHGSWRPRVSVTLPLSQAAAAQQMQETNRHTPGGNVLGKIVVVPES